MEEPAGDVVSGSTLAEGSTTPTRNRTDVTLPQANTTYSAEAAGGNGSGYEVANAWIVNRVDQTNALVYDHVLRTTVDANGCRWEASMTLDSSSGTARLGRTNVSLRKGNSTPWDGGSLPAPREGAGTAWDPADRRAYVLGGRNDSGDVVGSIHRYDPANGTSTNLTTSLPSPRVGSSAVWDASSGVAYVFGGWNASSGAETDEVVRFDPEAGTATVVDNLPTPRTRTAAVWNGSAGVAYVFGGHDGSTGNVTGEILRYDPGGGGVSTLDATVGDRERAGAAWDGSEAYVLGGRDDAGNRLDRITVFDPATGTTTNLSATLPAPIDDASAVWDGSAAYLVGGNDGSPRSAVVEFDPARDLVTTVDLSLPEARQEAGAVWTGSMALVLGGDDGSTVDAQVAHVNLTVGVLQVDGGTPSATGAELRPGGGEVLHHVVVARPQDHGSTTLDASLDVLCPTAGISSNQDVVYRFR